jgi:hypothetical protein
MWAKAAVGISVVALALSAAGVFVQATSYVLQAAAAKATVETNGTLGLTNLCFTWASYVEDLRGRGVSLREIDRRVRYLLPRFDRDRTTVVEAAGVSDESDTTGCLRAQGMFK